MSVTVISLHVEQLSTLNSRMSPAVRAVEPHEESGPRFSFLRALDNVGLSLPAIEDVVGKPEYVDRFTSTTAEPVASAVMTQPDTVQPAGTET